MATGEIPHEAVDNLKIAGDWLKKYGESIYDTKPSPFRWNYNWGYVTQKPNKLYLNIADWPLNNQIDLNGLLTKISSVNVLGNSKAVKYNQEGRFLKLIYPMLKKMN